MRRLAGLLAALGLLAPALTANAAAAAPQTVKVDAGGAPAYVRADPGAALAVVALFVRAGLDRQTTSQSGVAALAAETVLRTPVDGEALSDAVEARGGSVRFSLAPSYVRFSVEAPPDVVGTLAPLVARALARPSFDAPTIEASRAALGKRISENDDPRLVGLDMLRASYYRAGVGLPALGTAQSLAALTPSDVGAFYSRWYVRGNAFVAAAGRTGDSTDGASRALVAALPAGSATIGTTATRPYATQARRLVTHRDVGAPYVVVGFAAPALGNKDFAAALVMRSVLADVFDRVTSTTLPPPLRAVGTVYGYDAAPAQLAIWLNGARIDPTAGIAAINAVLSSAAKRPLTPGVLSRYKESARGEWALESLSLDERAAAIGNAVALGLAPDAPQNVGAAISRVTAADVQRVANAYFQRFDVALVLPRTAR